jgi:hypothetical protein
MAMTSRGSAIFAAAGSEQLHHGSLRWVIVMKTGAVQWCYGGDVFYRVLVHADLRL